MPLTPEEEQNLRQQLQSELEAEHQKRTEIAQRRLGKMSKTSISEEFQREKDLIKLRTEVRKQFYEDNGYIRTTDEHGIAIWMTPDEINIQKVRQKNAPNRFIRPHNPEIRRKRSRQKLIKSIPLILGAIIIGIIIGLLLVRSGG